MPVDLNSFFSNIDLSDLGNIYLDKGEFDDALQVVKLPSSISDVVNNLSWSVSNSTLARKECPIIQFTEYQQTVAAFTQSLNFLALQGSKNLKDGDTANEAITKTNDDPYKGLYTGDPTGNFYTFPFYNQYHHETTNSWGENRGNLQGVVDKGLDYLRKFYLPTAGMEVAQQWQGSTASIFTFSFYLLNTVDPKVDIPKNVAFVTALVHNNLLDRKNIFAGAPPVIYSYSIPGIRTSPAAVLSNVTIRNIGQINMIGGQNIPDAYEVLLTVTDLIKESRQIYRGASGGKVQTSIIPTSEGVLPSPTAPAP